MPMATAESVPTTTSQWGQTASRRSSAASTTPSPAALAAKLPTRYALDSARSNTASTTVRLTTA